MPELELLSAILGVVIGVMLALTGVGGATLAIPLLVFFLNLTIYQAAPIALLAVFLASSIGAIQGFRKSVVRYKTALLIASLGMIMAPIGAKLAQNTSNQILNLALIFILFFISYHGWKSATRKLEINNQIEPPVCMINPVTSRLFWTASCTKRLVATGVLSGFLSGLLGVGGGFIIRPSLYKVSNFDNQTIISTTLAAVALISVSSITSHIGLSHLNWHIAIPFGISAMLSMLTISEMFGHKITHKSSQKGLAIVCGLAAIHMSIKHLS